MSDQELSELRELILDGVRRFHTEFQIKKAIREKFPIGLFSSELINEMIRACKNAISR